MAESTIKEAGYWVEHMGLQPHPEGGFYRETYRSEEGISKDTLPERFGGDRSFCTGIYFLLPANTFSAFHRIKSDEMWHFYAGGTLEILVIHPDQTLETILLGANPENGEVFQAVVPANCWFASRPAEGSDYALVGCTVAPGFDFTDFELARGSELSAAFPQHAETILALTRM